MNDLYERAVVLAVTCKADNWGTMKDERQARYSATRLYGTVRGRHNCTLYPEKPYERDESGWLEEYTNLKLKVVGVEACHDQKSWTESKNHSVQGHRSL